MASSSSGEKTQDPSSEDVGDVTDLMSNMSINSPSPDHGETDNNIENKNLGETAGKIAKTSDFKSSTEVAKLASNQHPESENIPEKQVSTNAKEQSNISCSKTLATGTSGISAKPQSELEKKSERNETTHIHKLFSPLTGGKSPDDKAENQDISMLVKMKFECVINVKGEETKITDLKFLDIDSYSWKYLRFQPAIWAKIEDEMTKNKANIADIAEPDENDIRLLIESTDPLESKDKDNWVTAIMKTFNRYSQVLDRERLQFPGKPKKDLEDKFRKEPLSGLPCKTFFLEENIVLIVSDHQNIKKALTTIKSELKDFVVTHTSDQKKEQNQEVTLTFPSNETNVASGLQENTVDTEMDIQVTEDLLNMLLILKEEDYQTCLKDMKINDVFTRNKSSHGSKFHKRFLVFEIRQTKWDLLKDQICKTLGRDISKDSWYQVDMSSPSTTKLELKVGIKEHWIESKTLQTEIMKTLYKEGIACDVKQNGELVVWFRTIDEVDKAGCIATKLLKHRQFSKNRCREDAIGSMLSYFEREAKGLVKASLVEDHVIVSYHISKEEDIKRKFLELEEEYFIVEDAILLPDDVVKFCLDFESKIVQFDNVEIFVCCSTKSRLLIPALNKSDPGFYFRGSKRNVRAAKEHLKEMFVYKKFPLEIDQLACIKQSDGIQFVQKLERGINCKVEMIDNIVSTLNDLPTSCQQELVVLEEKQIHLSMVVGTLDDWAAEMVLFPLVNCQDDEILTQALQKYGMELKPKDKNCLRNLTSDGVTIHTIRVSFVGGSNCLVTFIALPNVNQLAQQNHEQKTISAISNFISTKWKEQTKSLLILFHDIVTMLGERGISSVFEGIKKTSQMNTASSLRILLLVDDMETARLMKHSAREQFGMRGKPKKNIRIVQGALTSIKADVLVNSAAHTLDLSHGEVSKSILLAAGEGMQNECKQKYPKGIQIGEIAETCPGKMRDKCKTVYHGVLPVFDKKEQVKANIFFKDLQMFVLLCLQHASEAGHQSIAFPALGTGKLGYPVDAVAQIMVQTVEEFNKRNPDGSLEEVVFVVYKQEDYRIFKGEYELRFLQTPKDHPRCVAKLMNAPCLVQIAPGSLNDVKSKEVLVCFEPSHEDEFLEMLSLSDDARTKAKNDLRHHKHAQLRDVFNEIPELKLFMMKERLPENLKKVFKYDADSRHIFAMSESLTVALANYITGKQKLPQMLQVVNIYTPKMKTVIGIAKSMTKSEGINTGYWWQSLIPKADTAFSQPNSGVGAFRITARTMDDMDKAYRDIMKFISDKEEQSSAYTSQEEDDTVIIESSEFDNQAGMSKKRNDQQRSWWWSFLRSASMTQKELKERLQQQGIKFQSLFPDPKQDNSFVVEVCDEDFGRFWSSYEKNICKVSKPMLMHCRMDVCKEFNPYLAEGKFLEKTGLTGQSDAGSAFIEGKCIQIIAAVQYFESRSSETPFQQGSSTGIDKSSTKPEKKSMNAPKKIEREFDREHYAAAKHFFGKDLDRNCCVGRNDGKVCVSFFDTEHDQQTIKNIEALNVENVDVLMTNESEMTNFTTQLMQEHKKVYVQLKSGGKSIAVISDEWDDMAGVKKKILQKYGVVKPKTRKNRNFKPEETTLEEINPEASQSAYYHDMKLNFEKKSSTSDCPNSFDVGCLKVKVYVTDMTKLKIDAIVNAANGNLSHGSGVARAISKAAGQQLENEGSRYVHKNGQIPVTEVVPTTAGNMPCKKVLHAVGPAWYNYKDSEKEICIEDLCKTVMRCLIVANQEGLESLAIPAISSGLFKVPEDQCCEAYVRGTRLFAESVVGTIHLKEVHFVDVKPEMVEKMKRAFSTLKDLSLNVTSREERFLKSNMPTLSPKHGLSIKSHLKNENLSDATTARFQRHTYRVGKKGTVKLYPFDLEKATTDAIICWNDSHMKPLTKASEALKSAAGTFKINKNIFEINFLEAFLSKAGNLSAKWLIHCIVPSDSLKVQELKKLLIAAINTGTFNEMDSISLDCFTNAAVGHREFCEVLIAAVEHCLDSDDTVPEVHVVDADASVVSTMKRVFDKKLSFEISEDIKDAHAAMKEAEATESCPICMDEITDAKILKCGHAFCIKCIDHHFKVNKPDCPSCGAVHGKVYGNMPPGTMRVFKGFLSLPGHNGGRFEIDYHFDAGYQGSEHPNTGNRYWGINRTAYLPSTKEGETVLRLLKIAFQRRLTFTIGRSTTTGKEGVITWNDIHHKTSDKYGDSFGYPDPGYFDRVKGELKAKGITEDIIDWSERLEGTIYSSK